jgi:hypothetical protein
VWSWPFAAEVEYLVAATLIGPQTTA